MCGPDFVSYKGSSQLNLRFHRLFCIHLLFLSFVLSFVRSCFLDNLRVFEQWKEFASCHSFAFQWFQLRWTCKSRVYTQKLQKSWNSIRIKRIAFIVLKDPKKQTHSGTRVPQYIYNCCYRKGEQMNFAVGLLFLKIQCVFFLLFSYSSANLSWNLHPNKKREKAFMIEVSNQNISPATT